MSEFNYRLDVKVSCTSVPEQEDIPEYASVEFSIDPDLKIAGIQQVLEALARAWPEMRELHRLKGKKEYDESQDPGS